MTEQNQRPSTAGTEGKPKCRRCGNASMARAGKRWSGLHRLQGYQCQKCGYKYTPTRIDEIGFCEYPPTAGTGGKPPGGAREVK